MNSQGPTIEDLYQQMNQLQAIVSRLERRVIYYNNIHPPFWSGKCNPDPIPFRKEFENENLNQL